MARQNKKKNVTEAKVAQRPTGSFSDLNAEKTKKVRFLMSPTGLLNLAYSPGEIAVFNEKQADFLISSGLAEKVG